MTQQHDLVLRGGTIVDGRGGEPYLGDVAVNGDLIAAVGVVEGTGLKEIDARGLLVTPGFVDIHTHYDGQAIWESRLSPSSGHGVTTVVIGNCGVGFAPCRSEDRGRLVELMEGVEDIPGIVLTTGLSWEWESYPEYLDAVEARPHDINIASYLPHAALRVYVMGERASYGEIASSKDIEAMATLAREAMEAGAIGFSSSRTLFHRSSKGDVTPTAEAGEEELTAIGGAMRSTGKGVLQIMNDYKATQDVPGEFGLMQRLAKSSGRPLTLPTFQYNGNPEQWREIMDLIERSNAEGLSIKGQVMPRGVGMLLGFELTMHPFTMCSSYQEIADLPFAERMVRLRDPERRARIISEPPADPSHPLIGFVRGFERMFEAGDPIDYEPAPECSIAARAARLGITPEELAYDLLLERDGAAMIFVPIANYADGNLDPVASMIRHKDFVVGLGDGGAHYGVICDASYSTFLLCHWTRDRKRGDRLSVAQAIKKLAYDTTRLMGLEDRGVIGPGFRADLNVIDYDRLALHAPQVAYDLPAGGRRLTQKADGYVATFVNGKLVYLDGEPTGALPGKLIRGAQPAPGVIAGR